MGENIFGQLGKKSYFCNVNCSNCNGMESLRVSTNNVAPVVRGGKTVVKKKLKIPEGCVSFEEFAQVFEQKLNAEYAKL